MKKRILVPVLMFFIVFITALCFCACDSNSSNGKSAYELYLESYLLESGSADGALSETEWLESLKGDRGNQGEQGEQGETGADGLSAYELYKKYTTDDPVLSETEWLESLKGDRGEQGELGTVGADGLSAYELYKKYTTDDPVLSETEWLESLKGAHGDQGVGIKQIDIVCGSIVINFTDGSIYRIENAYPEAGHHWDDGTITTPPTCKTAGVKTFVCNECSATKTVPVDADPDQHIYVKYEKDAENHWQTCSLCGNTVKNVHDFGDREESDPEGFLCEECGYIDSYVNHAYKITFVCSKGVSVRVYKTQDYENGGIESLIAYSRDSGTGEMIKNREGQVNFEIVFPEGHCLDGNIEIDSDNYKSLKGYEDTGKKNVWRITKITGNLTVTINSKILQPLYNFASAIDKLENKIKFSWDSDVEFDCVTVDVQSDGTNTTYNLDAKSAAWEYIGVPDDKNIAFNFSFMYEGQTIKQDLTKFYHPNKETDGFARIEINTKNNVLPSCDYVNAPSGCWGASIINNDYVYSTIQLYDESNTMVYDSTKDLNSLSIYDGARIKIRGNTSAYGEKKPYKIKLAKKVDLLANLVDGRNSGVSYADKEWLLLAGGARINQLIGWSVSETLQMEYTPAYSYIQLYLNGDYRGLYILCESVEQGNGSGDAQARCKVDDDGYIIELDAYWWNEDLYFTTPHTENTEMHFTFKYPDSDDINSSSPEYSYIKDYMFKFERALYSDDGTYLDYIDEESFAKWLLGHDIIGTTDSGGSNIYLTKRDSADSALYMSLLWDFDSMSGAYNAYSSTRQADFYYFPKLLQQESFVAKYKELFVGVKDQIVVDIERHLAKFDSQVYDSLLQIEQTRWGTPFKALETQANEKKQWFEQHLAWLAEELGVV